MGRTKNEYRRLALLFSCYHNTTKFRGSCGARIFRTSKFKLPGVHRQSVAGPDRGNPAMVAPSMLAMDFSLSNEDKNSLYLYDPSNVGL